MYEEPSKTGGWLVDGGSLGGRMLEMLLTFTDMVVGKEHVLEDKLINFKFIYQLQARKIIFL